MICLECENGFYPITLAEPVDICFPILPIEGCIKYDTTGQTSPDIFAPCLECDDNYYLEDGICKLRLYYDLNCIQFSLNEDICLECDTGYYLEYAFTKC